MRYTKKFLLIFLLITVIASAAGAVSAYCQLNLIRQSANSAVASIVNSVKEKYPEISDIEIAEILNEKRSKNDSADYLKIYGITEDSWFALGSERACLTAIGVNAAVCFAAGLVFVIAFLSYSAMQKKEAQRLGRYLAEINSGRYNLKIEENDEDQRSILANEIYKTTVTLKTQSENSLADKENLKKSLEDISHQLKTPLTSVIVLLDNLIDDREMSEELQREFLSDAKRSANHISFLVQSLLKLSKLEANSIELKRRPENCNVIFDEVLKNTSVLADLRGVSVIADGGDVEINCDFYWLCEAIGNIVKNCIEHTPEGGKVTLSARDNRLYTKITVTDNGCGIDKRDLPHIFERFYKGRNAGENSVGIGLAMAKTIIEKNGGYVTVSSTVGKGSTFEIIYFRVNRADAN